VGLTQYGFRICRFDEWPVGRDKGSRRQTTMRPTWAAARRNRPWFSATNISALTSVVEQDYEDEVVDLVFWWLIVYGVVTFDNVD